jgi:methylated-DNA-[protein]-cysteine S-methyltransferase
MTASMLRYTIFDTRWGCFGLACTGERVCRTILPMPDAAAVRTALLADWGCSSREAVFEKGLARAVRQRIVAYFEGENIDFSTAPAVDLGGLGLFTQALLTACRQIPIGQTQTYAALARSIGRSHGARAAGNALAANPIPLIVPCHRVLRTDGGLGGFSAPGGTATKQKMLLHEQSMCPSQAQTISSGSLWIH